MNKVKCELCNNHFKGLAGHLKARHGISTLEYKNKYPNSLTLSENFYNKIKLNNENSVRKCENCDNKFNFFKNKKKRFCSSECMYKFISM